ncbi:unnamed protein product [Pleuronectes platessa]|uniref:Uncharacterized protein n=1 Tax=Pleuronectes platessa TaxID=8262 RepID=A0A9N7Z315_PLEPL|nr:unnamed protein product [Pleuronectes platessa]
MYLMLKQVGPSQLPRGNTEQRVYFNQVFTTTTTYSFIHFCAALHHLCSLGSPFLAPFSRRLLAGEPVKARAGIVGGGEYCGKTAAGAGVLFERSSLAFLSRQKNTAAIINDKGCTDTVVVLVHCGGERAVQIGSITTGLAPRYPASARGHVQR